jgi:ATP-dependent protease ClpP protease subunit
MNDASVHSSRAVLDRLAERRILMLGSEVDDDAAADLVARLLLLSVEDPVIDI